MAAPQVASTTIGLSTGAVFLIAGIVVVGSIIYFTNKKKKSFKDINYISNEKEKYETNKWIIKNAIEKNDFERLEKLLDTKDIKKNNEFIKIIEEALKSK